MNPFTLFKIRKAFRETNITIALAVSFALLGYSASATFRSAFAWTGLWTPLVWILSLFAVGFLAKKEKKLKIPANYKKIITFSLVLTSVTLSLALWRYRVYWESRIPPPPPEKKAAHERFGPRR